MNRFLLLRQLYWNTEWKSSFIYIIEWIIFYIDKQIANCTPCNPCTDIKSLIEWEAHLHSLPGMRTSGCTSAAPKPGHISSWKPASLALRMVGNTPTSLGAVLHFTTWWMARVVFNRNNKSVHQQPSLIFERR